MIHSDDVRQYRRHATDIPILLGGADDDETYCMQNISQGGLCFQAARRIEPGTSLRLRVPVCQPSMTVDGKVVWSRPAGGIYETGVQFDHAELLSKAWMVEQVRSIEIYKFIKTHNEGRALNGEQAAREWLASRPNLTPPAS
ncbi:MAG: PilZ domain-containing protein [Gammaproteobacteria bacterium]|nr:PilZ domain-containing protein [Gammaproteobacteria bacterium]MDH3464457.1 PilZ domain-containing protein [Gammaproteobacteria bacterium]